MAEPIEKTKDVAVIQKQTGSLVLQADKLEVSSPEDMQKAGDLLKELTFVLDKIEVQRRPFKDAVKAEKAFWLPFENKIKGAVENVRGLMGAYQTQQKRIADEKAAKIAARIGEGKGKLGLEAAGKQLEKVEKPAERVETEVGSVTFRTDYELMIVDVDQIPRTYMLPDEKRLKEDLKKGIVIPGVKLEEKQVPVNNRR